MDWEWEIIYGIIVVINIVIVSNNFYRYQKGPTQKERTRIENKHGHSLTEQDIKSYKSSQIIAGITRALVIGIVILIAM